MKPLYLRGSQSARETIEVPVTVGGLSTTCSVDVEHLVIGRFEFPCGSGDTYVFTAKECLSLLEFANENRNRIRTKEEVKTEDGWQKSGFEYFSDYVLVGDVVSEGLVDYFLNVLPPVSMKYGYVQSGGAVSHEDDGNGLARPTYLTFVKTDENKWRYFGPCFRGKSEPQGDTRTRLQREISELQNKIKKTEQKENDEFER